MGCSAGSDQEGRRVVWIKMSTASSVSQWEYERSILKGDIIGDEHICRIEVGNLSIGFTVGVKRKLLLLSTLVVDVAKKGAISVYMSAQCLVA